MVDKTYTATNDGKVLSLELSVDIIPSVTRADGCSLFVRSKGHLVDFFQGDSNSSLDA